MAILVGTMPPPMLLPGFGIIVGLTFGTMPMLLGTMPMPLGMLGTIPPMLLPGLGTMPPMPAAPSMGVGTMPPRPLPGVGIMPPPAALVGMNAAGALLLISAVLGSPGVQQGTHAQATRANNSTIITQAPFCRLETKAAAVRQG